MADISKIKPNGASGEEYEIKDTTARTGVLHLNAVTQSSKTVSGNPITITDAAPINAEDITVDIEPQQDLHGYDKPWAGGAGKNKLPMTVAGVKAANTSGTWSGNVYTVNGLTFTVQTDSDGNVIGIKVTGTASATSYFLCSPTFTLPNGSYIKSGCPSGGSGTSYFLGGSNTGRNDIGSGATFTSTGASTEFVICIGNGYAIATSGLLFKPMCRLATETDATFAPYSNECPIEGWTGAELTQKDNATNPTVTRTYSTDFGETVYGGKWHVTEGGTDKTHASVEYDGSSDEDWSMSSGTGWHQFYRNVPGCTSSADSITNEFEPIDISERGEKTGFVLYNDRTHRFALKDSDILIESVEDWRAYLAQHPLQICYELATPTTLSTPKQNVPMLQGINTVYADCGDTSLKYQPDNVVGELKGEIEDNIIYEDFKWTTESSQSYSAGTPGTYGTSSWRDVKKEGYDVIGVTFVENRRFGDCILTLYYVPSTSHVDVIIFRATSSAVTIADEDIVYRVAYKKRT